MSACVQADDDGKIILADSPCCNPPPYTALEIFFSVTLGTGTFDTAATVFTIDFPFGRWNISVDPSDSASFDEFGPAPNTGKTFVLTGAPFNETWTSGWRTSNPGMDLRVPIGSDTGTYAQGFLVYCAAIWDPMANGGEGAPAGMLISLTGGDALIGSYTEEVHDPDFNFYDFGTLIPYGNWTNLLTPPDYFWSWVPDNGYALEVGVQAPFANDLIPFAAFPPNIDPDSDPATPPPSTGSVDVRIENP